MEKFNIGKAAEFTSPNPLVLVCSQKTDGTTNLAPVSFVTYLSFNPPMIGFAMGKKAHTGECVKNTKEVIITIPAKELVDKIVNCGISTGSDTNKAEKFGIELENVDGSNIQIPKDSKAAFIATLNNVIETGDHYFYICDIKEIYGAENKEALFAWNGYSKIATAQEK